LFIWQLAFDGFWAFIGPNLMPFHCPAFHELPKMPTTPGFPCHKSVAIPKQGRGANDAKHAGRIWRLFDDAVDCVIGVDRAGGCSSGQKTVRCVRWAGKQWYLLKICWLVNRPYSGHHARSLGQSPT
jgi:hypothetical protein